MSAAQSSKVGKESAPAEDRNSRSVSRSYSKRKAFKVQKVEASTNKNKKKAGREAGALTSATMFRRSLMTYRAA